MKILLDTHIWIWNLAGSKELPTFIKKQINDGNSEIWISPVTIWETIILGEKNKIKLSPNPIAWIREALEKNNYKEASLNIEVALKSRELKTDIKDPGDRFIVATAIIYDLKLATIDSKIKKIDSLSIL